MEAAHGSPADRDSHLPLHPTSKDLLLSSSALADRRCAEVLEEHSHLLRAAFEDGNGQEIDTQGDAFLVAFSWARDALGMAVAAQWALTKHAWPDGASLRVRMALHTGELVSETGGTSV